MPSIFMDKAHEPTASDLKEALGETYAWWQELADYAHGAYPKYNEGWKHSGVKYGWGFRINDQKRAIVYLLPRDKHFEVALVFGPKATEAVLASNVNASLKNDLLAAKPYAEGRGIRITVADSSMLEDVKTLINLKIQH